MLLEGFLLTVSILCSSMGDISKNEVEALLFGADFPIRSFQPCIILFVLLARDRKFRAVGLVLAPLLGGIWYIPPPIRSMLT
jgi:hypothetical protein